jgi:hypothetical protein
MMRIYEVRAVDITSLDESGVNWNAAAPVDSRCVDEAGIWACRMAEKSFIRLRSI